MRNFRFRKIIAHCTLHIGLSGTAGCGITGIVRDWRNGTVVGRYIFRNLRRCAGDGTLRSGAVFGNGRLCRFIRHKNADGNTADDQQHDDTYRRYQRAFRLTLGNSRLKGLLHGNVILLGKMG